MSTHDSGNAAFFAEFAQQLDTLLMVGANRFDPAGYHLIDTMLRRSQQQAAPVQRYMRPRIEKALHAFQHRFETARQEAASQLSDIEVQHPLRVEQARLLHDACDFAALKRLHSCLQSSERGNAFAELTQTMQGGTLTDDDALLDTPDNPSLDALLKKQEKEVLQALGQTAASTEPAKPELKAMQLFRDTWAKVSTERRVSKVVEHAPRDTGPLNSQTLVVRSLTTMRALSPEYANRFVSYIDTLLWLERSAGRADSAPDKGTPGKPPTAKTASAKSTSSRAPATKTRAPRKRSR